MIKLMRWMIILPLLEDGEIAHKISRETNITYSHISKVTKQLEKFKLLNIKKEGRINKTILTKKGKKISELCRQLKHETRGFYNADR